MRERERERERERRKRKRLYFFSIGRFGDGKCFNSKWFDAFPVGHKKKEDLVYSQDITAMRT